MSYQKVFPNILEKTYTSCKNATVGKVPAVSLFSLISGGKIIALPFLDTINLKKISKNEFSKVIGIENKKIEIRLSESNVELKALEKMALNLGFYKNIVKGHIISELTSEEDFWKRFHKHTRNDIRKAGKSGLKIEKIESLGELKLFYKLYFKQMKKFGTPQHSFKFFKNCFEMMGKDFFGLNCYKGKNLVGSIILFIDGNYVYVPFNISDSKFRALRPNDLLYWESLKWCMGNKIKSFDIGQIDLSPKKGSRAEALLKFKKKWLGKEYRKIYFTKGFTYNESGNSSLKKLRPIWSKLPNSIIKIIGPRICSQLG